MTTLQEVRARFARDQALREAQLALIRQLPDSKDDKLRQSPPLYWAGFVCHGRSQ